METIFKSVAAKLKTITELKWIDHDFGQLELENPPVNYPCALIDVPDILFSQTTLLEQQGDTTVTVRLAFKVYDRTTTEAPTLMQGRAVEHFAVLKKVWQALHGHEDDDANFNTLIRTALQRGKSIEPRVYTLTFKTALFNENTPETIEKNTLDLGLSVGLGDY